MFADSLLDSAYGNRSRRGWTTLVSFTAQALGVGMLLILPLIHPEGVPRLKLPSPVSAIFAPPSPPPQLQEHSTTTAASNISVDNRLISPPSIPSTIHQITDITPPPPVDLAGVGVENGTGNRAALNSVMNSIGTAVNSVAPPRPTVTRRPLLSHMMEGNLIHRVEPRYPPLAIQARIQGDVVLQAVISRSGTIENLQLVSGHPMLVRAAMEAVRQWQYRPCVLNDEAIEVETQVTVKFILNN
jgi:periplasmic protein TonB